MSILAALHTLELKIAARPLPTWCARTDTRNGAAGRIEARTVADALVEDAVRTAAFTINRAGEPVLAPEE